MGWTEVTRKTDRTDSAGVVTQENTPLTPLETTERTTERPDAGFERATVGRSDGRADGSISRRRHTPTRPDDGRESS